MSNLRFDIDVDGISSQFEQLKKEIKADVMSAAEQLALMTHAKVVELTGDLGSLRKKYNENLEFENPQEGLWVVTLKAKALFIEEGRKSGFMQELLDGKSAKTSKDGKKYAVIPFEHSKDPQEQSPKAQDLANQIKAEFKKRRIPFKKIETNPDGSPRLGRIHTLNIESARPTAKAKYPALQGVAVYQNKDKTGKVRKDIMTFRVITEDHEQEGRWVHPGLEGKKLFDEALKWAIDIWDREILPSILDKYK